MCKTVIEHCSIFSILCFSTLHNFFKNRFLIINGEKKKENRIYSKNEEEKGEKLND